MGCLLKAFMKVKVKSCLTLCNPMDCSLPGSSNPWDFPGKSTGVGCHFLLQGIFPTQGLKPGLSHCKQILYHLSHQGSPILLLLLYIAINKPCICSQKWGWQSIYRALNESLKGDTNWQSCNCVYHCIWHTVDARQISVFSFYKMEGGKGMKLGQVQ